MGLLSGYADPFKIEFGRIENIVRDRGEVPLNGAKKVPGG